MELLRLCTLPAVAVMSLVAVAPAIAQEAPTEAPPTADRPATGAATESATAPVPEAEALFERGLRHFQDREFEAAIEAFDAAYAIDPQPKYLYANAQAERLSGDCPSAVILYRRFLTTNPIEMHATVARDGVARCQRALSSRPQLTGPVGISPGLAPPAPAPPAAATSPTVTTTVGPRRSNAPWYTDAVGDTLLGAGVIGLTVGGVYLAKASGDVATADKVISYDAYDELLGRAHSRRRIGLIAVGAGSALVVGAAVRYALFRGAPESPAVVVTAGDGSVGVVAAGTF